jgi:SAM-dependent methyltransferase
MKILKTRKLQEIEELKALNTNESLFNDGLDDPKRHFEMLSIALPILKALNPESILTLGDTYGRDAYLYKKEIGCRVIASDLDADKLIFAKNQGYIDDFLELDAENMHLDSDSVDIVVAKETLHHWPRPMLGVYEALRVARKGAFS